jgi:hypothetical protein
MTGIQGHTVTYTREAQTSDGREAAAERTA